MPGLRKVYGPFKIEAKEAFPLINGVLRNDSTIDFHFFGIRDDHHMGIWVLRYTSRTRSFKAFNLPLGKDIGGRKMSALGIHVDRIEPDREMFVKGEKLPVMTGTITDILRKHLKPEHIAMCIALTITGRKTQ